MVQAENLLATVRPLLATLWQHFKSVACPKATLAFKKKRVLGLNGREERDTKHMNFVILL